jgi:rhodanese-related sulfurtransferase
VIILKLHITIVPLLMLAAGVVPAADADQDRAKGQVLFEEHGCTNCHGPEVAFLGMPAIADANIPYMTVGRFDEWDEKRETFKLQPNSEFTARVNALIEERGMEKDAPIFLICRSGSRSAKAANILSLAGYDRVYVITDGFEGDKAKAGPRKGERVVNGWKNAGLPWTYKLDKQAMYWDF